jgi:hypothetical protein
MSSPFPQVVTNGSGNHDDDLPRFLDIAIDPPIDFSNGKRYEVMHLEEPNGEMIERAEAELAVSVNVHTLRKYQIALVSHASGIPSGAVRRMRISQIKEAADFLTSFTSSGPETGES